MYSTIFLCFLALTTVAGQPTAFTPRGNLTGNYFTSRNGITYEGYVGISYGVVLERFEIAVRSPSWEGTKNATEFGPVCAQMNTFTQEVFGVENCLFLNVYTPKADDKKRPVLVFIHGGGFAVGSSDVAGGKYFIDEDIVLVTLNYRLGILGFMNTRDDHVTGNMGLKDQVLALQWIQENIEAFGGDPAKVTISGESAGGASVMYHVLSSASTGLFHRAISQSGSALNPWAYNSSTLENSIMVGQHLKCNTSTTAELVSCLKQKSLTEVVGAQGIFTKWHIDPMYPFPPSLEIKSNRNPEPLVYDSPRNMLKSEKFQRVPVLFTINKEEGSLMHAATIVRRNDLLKDMNEDWNHVAPITFQLVNIQEFEGRLDEVVQKLREFYFKNESIDLNHETNLTNLYTDSWFLHGVHETALALAKHTPLYTAVISHPREDFSILSTVGITENLGVTTHIEEIPFLFNSANQVTYLQKILAQNEVKDEDDVEFSKALVETFATFVRHGTPEPEEDITGMSCKPPESEPVSSEEVESGSLNWFGMGREPGVQIKPFEDRMNVWTSLYNQDKAALNFRSSSSKEL